MFADLPEDLKVVVTRYLLDDNFPRAKQIHDNWIASHCSNENPTEWRSGQSCTD